MSTRRPWRAEDRQAFADRNILRAQRIPDKRKQADKRACRRRTEH